MEIWILLVAIAAGYVGSIYSWPWLRAKWNGLEVEARALRDRAIALEQKIRGR